LAGGGACTQTLDEETKSLAEEEQEDVSRKLRDQVMDGR